VLVNSLVSLTYRTEKFALFAGATTWFPVGH
jgi:hypothetical protein